MLLNKTESYSHLEGLVEGTIIGDNTVFLLVIDIQ